MAEANVAMVNRLYPWAFHFDSVGSFTVTNDLTTNVKFGLKYAKYVHDMVPGNYSLSQVFYARAAGIRYFLAMSKDRLPASTPMISHLPSKTEQVVFVSYKQGIVCDHHSFSCESGIKLDQVWAFWNEGHPIPAEDASIAAEGRRRPDVLPQPPARR